MIDINSTTKALFFHFLPFTILAKVLFLIFKLIGLRIEAEVSTNEGRIDAVIETTERIFLFEFKLNGAADEALTQIKDNHYYEKYQLHGKPITLIGANFDSEKRKVTEWKSEAAPES